MPKKVLVVEDHPQQNKDLCDIVKEAGYEPVSATDGFQAFHLLKRHRRGLGFLPNGIHCILLDWNMPEMTGDAFLRLMRRKEHQQGMGFHIPVVFVTIYGELEKIQFSASTYVAMASDYICKPFDAEEVISVLHKILRDGGAGQLVEKLQEKSKA